MSNSSSEGNFISDAFSSAKELITDRFSSPFIFSYVIAWLLLNYKAIVIIFTDTTEKWGISDKVEQIQAEIETVSLNVPFLEEWGLFNSFTLAFFAACFYTFFYPLAEIIITAVTVSFKVIIRNLKIRIEEDVYYKSDDIRRFSLTYEQTEKELRARNEVLQSTIQRLRDEAKLFSQSESDEKNIISVTNNESENNEEKLELIDIEGDLSQKLELAIAFIDMGDFVGAENSLDEVLAYGNKAQVSKAKYQLTKLKELRKIEVSNKLTIDEKKSILIIGQRTDSGIEKSSLGNIQENSNLSVSILRLTIGKLVEKGYLKSTAEYPPRFYLTQKGLEYYVVNGEMDK